MRARNRHNRNKAGMAAVEMALLLPMFLILILGVLDFSRYCWTKNVISDAAAQGARVARLFEPSDSQVINTVISEITSGGVSSSPSVTVGERVSETPVSVTVSVPFQFIVLNSFFSEFEALNTVSATAVMRHER